MNLTDKLKGWLIEHASVPETASEDEFKEAVLEALQSGKLTPAKLAELTAEAKADEPDEDQEKAEAAKIIGEMIAQAVAPLTGQVGEIGKAVTGLQEQRVAATKEAEDKAVAEAVDKIGRAASDALDEPPENGNGKSDKATSANLFGGNDGGPNHKKAIDQYSGAKSAAVYPDKHRHFPGQPVKYAGAPIDHPSQQDLAVAGAYFKFAANASPGGRGLPSALRMTDHDRELMQHAIKEMPWTGIIGGEGSESTGSTKVDGRHLTPFEQKDLIDEAGASRGLEAAPIAFDAAVIITPLLHGELFPLVNVIPVARGRRMEGFKIGNPTFTSNIGEGTASTPFNTANFITAFDTTIFCAMGSLELGNDLEEDSPVNLGALIVQRYGEQALTWLDTQIAAGDGTTEPQGCLLPATGITDIGNPAGGAGATAQIDDFETLLFSLAKEYRPPNQRARIVFLSNEVSYRRARAIAVGAADERRVFGMTHEDYQLLGHPYKINSTLANSHVGCFNLAYYRMYRRLGLSVRVETAGNYLALRNLSLITVRMRWGGQLELGGAGAYTDNAQA